MRRGLAIWLLALAAAALVFGLFPQLDLWAERPFYDPQAGFFLADAWPLRTLYRGVPLVVQSVVLAGLLVVLLYAGRRPDVGRKVAYLSLALILGPGLVVNTALKDHWGRARPHQVAEFGGSQAFTPAPLPADQCRRNCSFPAGHPAIGFYFISFAFLVRERRRRQIAIGASVALGAALGIARMAQGGHFLSDAVFAGIIVIGISWLLYRLVIVEDRLRFLARVPAPPRRLVALWLATIALALLSIAFLDRPVAVALQSIDPGVHDAFVFITQFGLGKGWLIASAALAIALALAARLLDRPRLLREALRALFFFLAVAISGLAVDLLKIAFGRARPKLLLSDHLYGFEWGAMSPAQWSFPSGHATTIAAVATALYLLWPRGLALYVALALVVAASRVIIDAHYVSDVVVGTIFGGTVAWLCWRGFARAGFALERGAERRLALTPADEGRSGLARDQHD